jgi:hypothetical protein
MEVSSGLHLAGKSSVFPGLGIRKFQSIAIEVTGVAWYRAQFMFARRFPACCLDARSTTNTMMPPTPTRSDA